MQIIQIYIYQYMYIYISYIIWCKGDKPTLTRYIYITLLFSSSNTHPHTEKCSFVSVTVNLYCGVKIQFAFSVIQIYHKPFL